MLGPQPARSRPFGSKIKDRRRRPFSSGQPATRGWEGVKLMIGFSLARRAGTPASWRTCMRSANRLVKRRVDDCISGYHWRTESADGSSNQVCGGGPGRDVFLALVGVGKSAPATANDRLNGSMCRDEFDTGWNRRDGNVSSRFSQRHRIRLRELPLLGRGLLERSND